MLIWTVVVLYQNSISKNINVLYFITGLKKNIVKYIILKVIIHIRESKYYCVGLIFVCI